VAPPGCAIGEIGSSHHNLTEVPSLQHRQTYNVEGNREWPERDVVRHDGGIRAIECPTPRAMPSASVRCTLTAHESENQGPAFESKSESDSQWENNYVDAIMCCMQGTSKKGTIVGFGSLPMRMGVAKRRSGKREINCVPYANTKVCLK
jgi:hypothetical protein